MLKYCLGPIPYSVVNANGTLMRTNKSKLLELLECYSKPCETDVNNVSTCLYDGMAVIQSLSSQLIPETMGELARLVFSIIMKHKCNNLRGDFICDRYSEVSIKNAERNRRASVSGIHTRILSVTRHAPSNGKVFIIRCKQGSFCSINGDKIALLHITKEYCI